MTQRRNLPQSRSEEDSDMTAPCRFLRGGLTAEPRQDPFPALGKSKCFARKSYAKARSQPAEGSLDQQRMVQDAHRDTRIPGRAGHSEKGSRLTRTQGTDALNRQKGLATKSAVFIRTHGLDIIHTHRPVAQAVPASTILRRVGIVGERILTLFQGLLLAAGATSFHGFFCTVPAGARHAIEGAP